MNTKITEEQHRYLRKKGQRQLRSILVLFYLFLLFYSMLTYFVIDMLIPDHSSWLISYVWKTAAMLILWCCVVASLWRYRNIGRLLFALMAILSLLEVKDILGLYTISQSDQVLTMMLYLFTALVCLKLSLALFFAIKFYTDLEIASIWSLPRRKKDEVEALAPIESYDIINTYDQQPIDLNANTNSKLFLRARRHIRINTWLLVFLCYGGFLCFYLLLVFFQLSNRQDVGIQYVQRYTLLSTMYSIMVWIPAITALFMYHKFTKLCIAIAWCGEFIRLLYQLPTLFDVFTTQEYSLLSLSILLSVELIRYLLYYRITKRILMDSLIRYYWSDTTTQQEVT